MANQSELLLKNPIFLLASERSGSNLIRVIFGSHKNIAAPAPPHLLFTFMPLLSSYGDLEVEDNFARLCDDIHKVFQNKLASWDIDFSLEELLSSVKSRSFIGIFDYIYHKSLAATNANRVFFKEIDTHQYAYFLLKHYPDAKFIYLVRDGRDFAVSSKNSPNHPGTIKDFATKWSLEQQEMLTFYTNERRYNRVFPIHYEDLTTFPEEILTEACAFLGEEFDENMLEFYKQELSIKESKAVKNWNNLSKDFLQKNYQKYRKELSQSDIVDFESISFRELIKTGYQLENDPDNLTTGSNLAGKLKKGTQLMSKIARGKTMPIKELSKRNDQFQQISKIKSHLDNNLKPLLRCKALASES